MKVVVADASPFVGLIKIGHVRILPGFFTTIIIPPEILSNLSKPTQAKEVLDFAAAPPVWLVIRAATWDRSYLTQRVSLASALQRRF